MPRKSPEVQAKGQALAARDWQVKSSNDPSMRRTRATLILGPGAAAVLPMQVAVHCPGTYAIGGCTLMCTGVGEGLCRSAAGLAGFEVEGCAVQVQGSA